MTKIGSIWVRGRRRPWILTFGDFLELKPTLRAELLREQRVDFYDLDGTPIPLDEAVALLLEREPSPRDRRRHLRTIMNEPIRIALETSRSEHVGVGVDLSQGGLLLRAIRRFEPGEGVRVAWSVGLTSREVWRFGRVVRASADADAGTVFPRLVAVRFDAHAQECAA